MGFLSLVIFDLILHVAWDIIEDRIPSVRRITHQNIINESTDLLVKQIEEMKPTLKSKLKKAAENGEIFIDDHGAS